MVEWVVKQWVVVVEVDGGWDGEPGELQARQGDDGEDVLWWDDDEGF